MAKPRHKMTEAEVKESEYWQKLRGTKDEHLRFELMLKHAGGQCQVKHGGVRCPNKHLEPGVTVNGLAVLTPRNGFKPYLHCQKCGFEEVKKELAKPIHGRGKGKKVTQFQVGMFA